MIPTQTDVEKAKTGPWLIIIAFWLILACIAVTLALSLAIWNLWQAF